MSEEHDIDRVMSAALRGVADCVRPQDLKSRFVQARREGRRLRVKLGMDPTAPDLHLGHAVVLRKLRQFQDLGSEAVLVIGGATAMLGDPSGKDRTRPQLGRDEVERNARTYLDQAGRILLRDSLSVVNNAEWFLEFRFEDLLKLASRMTVARMIERDLFARRLEQGSPIGIHEFLYPLLQGWDSVKIRADVELGGSDQLFNLLVGRDLQEQEGQMPQICMTMPLLPGLDGHKKMSKSLGNYIGLEFAPEDMFGKVMSVPDELMRSYYLLLTDLGESEIDGILGGNPRESKAVLAERITSSLHGSDAAVAARRSFDRIFKERELPENIEECVIDLREVPDEGIWIVQLLRRLGFASSNAEARRLIQGRGVRLDGEVIDDVERRVKLDEALLVQAGKRRFARVRAGG